MPHSTFLLFSLLCLQKRLSQTFCCKSASCFSQSSLQSRSDVCKRLIKQTIKCELMVLLHIQLSELFFSLYINFNAHFKTHHVISSWCYCPSQHWSTLGLRSPAGMRTLLMFTMSWSTPQPQIPSSTWSTTTLLASLSSSARETWRLRSCRRGWCLEISS